MRERIYFLDGLRGVAIIAVIIFHAYVNDPTHLPFSDRFNVLPWRLGWQGVELFFLISGFVILLTLERTSGLLEFAWLRWTRLFPTMLVASLLGFWLSKPPVLDLVPGLTFLSPALIHALTGLDPHSISGVFWSLYVEVAFYAVFGTVFFISGPRYAIASVFGLFLVSAISSNLAFPAGSLAWRIAAATRWVGFIYFGWLASGALFYLFFRSRDPRVLALAIGGGLTSIAMTDYSIVDRLGLLFAVATFAMTIIGASYIQRMLAWRPIVFIGTISYPLYLIHLAIIDALMPFAAREISGAHPLFWQMPAILISILLAWLIHIGVEKPVTRVAHNFARRRSARDAAVPNPT